jgi:hypothetical protein
MSYMFDPLSMLWTYQCFERNASRRRAAVKDRSAYGLELSEMWGSISWGRVSDCWSANFTQPRPGSFMITVAVTAFQTDKVFVGVLIFALSGICVKKLVLAGAPIGS